MQKHKHEERSGGAAIRALARGAGAVELQPWAVKCHMCGMCGGAMLCRFQPHMRSRACALPLSWAASAVPARQQLK